MDYQIDVEAADLVRIGDSVYYVEDPDLDEQTALLVPVELLQITARSILLQEDAEAKLKTMGAL